MDSIFITYIFLIPELYLFSLLLVYLFCFFINRKYAHDLSTFYSYVLVAPLSILFALFFLLAAMFPTIAELNTEAPLVIFRSQLIVDPLAFFFKLITVFFTGLYLPLVANYLKLKGLQVFEFFSLVLLVVLAIFFLASSFDFLTVYAAVELQSLILYVLATQERYTFSSTEAGLKYFIVGSLASGFLLYGITVLYGLTGSTNFGDISKFVTVGGFDSYFIVLGICFILAALFFKIGLVPFHLWLPDVYAGSSTAATAFFATISKIGLVVVLVRLVYTTFLEFSYITQALLLILSVLSIVVGGIGALNQINLKRLLAYSGISHMGFMCLGLATGSPVGLVSVLMYLIIYLALSLVMFGIILMYTTKDISLKKANYHEAITLYDFIPLAQTNPTVAAMLAATLFSLAGVPPFAGFFSKYYVLSAAISSGFYLTSLIAVLISVLSCFYYIRLIKILYFENKQENSSYIIEAPFDVTLILGFLVSFNVFFVLIASPLHTFCSYIVNLFFL